MFNVTTDGAPIPAGAHTIRILKVRFQLSPIVQHPEQDFSRPLSFPFTPCTPSTVDTGDRSGLERRGSHPKLRDFPWH